MTSLWQQFVLITRSSSRVSDYWSRAGLMVEVLPMIVAAHILAALSRPSDVRWQPSLKVSADKVSVSGPSRKRRSRETVDSIAPRIAAFGPERQTVDRARMIGALDPASPSIAASRASPAA